MKSYAETSTKGDDMTGYLNAPHIEPQVGDVVECGLPGDTATVYSIAQPQTPGWPVRNCAIDGKLHLNDVAAATLVRTVDGRKPVGAPGKDVR